MHITIVKKILLGCFALLMSVMLHAQNGHSKPVKPSPPLMVDKDGKLLYTPDSLGNRIPDFSYCGYKAGEKPIPGAPVKIVVPVKDGDATLRIQQALNYVATLPADSDGIRGAVLLLPGKYLVQGRLELSNSGVILRGSGVKENGTVMIGAGEGRETLIELAGKNNRRLNNATAITDAYVPVNGRQLHVMSNNFKQGDKVIIHVPFTTRWIELLGTGHFGGGITSLGWKPGDRFIQWDRTITASEGNTITLDAPVTTAIDSSLTQATISAYSWPERLSNCGVENLQLVSAYNSTNEKDEGHRWMAVTINNAEDCWVRQVTFRHFAGSAVAVWENAKRITVEDAISQQPVSEIGGWRRNTFFTSGQQTLFQRCYAEYGYHDFATGFCAAGPNAFVQCESHLPYSFSGAIDSWSSGILMDVVYVDGHAISFMNRGQDGQGAGWSAANSLLWNCSASRIDCYKPPMANNWSFGSWAQFAGDGYWAESNNSIEPRSLYYAQLAERIGDAAKQRSHLLLVTTDASSSPTVEQATYLTAQSVQPAGSILSCIEGAAVRAPIEVNSNGIKTVDELPAIHPVAAKHAPTLQIKNGWLVKGDAVVTGARNEVPWWNGNVRRNGLEKAGPHITRYVPGRTGTGLTDNLDEMTDSMLAANIVAIDHNYGLWYERRRDDHERIRRMDGDVWPPYYELPFARSGKELAWDGLSKYDLTKYNKWYWQRLAQYASLADKKGLVLLHQNYFQHNIIEAGAHYADFPWRSANNINNTGFPEPPPYAGDKRIFMAEQFYDTANSQRRSLHIQYINQCLNNFSGNSSVIQFTGAEFTGPFHFVKFWFNTIKLWQLAHRQKQLTALSVTKDVQDSILHSDVSDVVDVIDIRYWHYQQDEKLYAPNGGLNLAPRQHARLLKPKRTSFEQVYRAVLEYKKLYPAKAVMYSADSYDHFGWAIFMAGGSLAQLPAKVPQALLQAASAMRPVDSCVLGNNKGEYIVYKTPGAPLPVVMLLKGTYIAVEVNPADGMLIKTYHLKGGSRLTLPVTTQPVVVWVRKK